jgi:hypothetical protein
MQTVKAKKIGGRYRVVNENDTILRSRQGKALDGGGHPDASRAKRQADHINRNTRHQELLDSNANTSGKSLREREPSRQGKYGSGSGSGTNKQRKSKSKSNASAT